MRLPPNHVPDLLTNHHLVFQAGIPKLLKPPARGTSSLYLQDIQALKKGGGKRRLGNENIVSYA